MKLLIVLICMGIQRYLNIRFSLSDMDWFKPYRGLVSKTLGQSGMLKGYIGLAIFVLPIAVLVWILNGILSGSLLLELIVGAAIVFYCLDARDIGSQISNYLSGGKAEKGKTSEEELAGFLKGSVPKSASDQARAVSTQISLVTQHHVFSVLFWYLFLGVFGAVVYFLVHRIAHEAEHKDSDVADVADASRFAQAIMAWVPVRLAGLSLGVVGAFGTLFNQWMKNIAGGLDLEQKLPVIFGLSAVNADLEKADKASVEENKGLLDLVFKAEIVWIAAFGLFALISLI